MQCPVCNGPMKKGDRSGVPLDFCAQCGGAWLDLYQLDLILYRTKPTEVKKESNDEDSDLEIPARVESRRR